MNSVDAIPSCFVKINFNIILPSTPKSESGVFRKWTDMLFRRISWFTGLGAQDNAVACNRQFHCNFSCCLVEPLLLLPVHPKFHFTPYTHWLGNELIALPLRTQRENRNNKRSKHQIPEFERSKHVGVSQICGNPDRSFRQLQSLPFRIIRVKIKSNPLLIQTTTENCGKLHNEI